MGQTKRQRKVRSTLATGESDQLGCFAPGTVLWVLTHASPIWPARVLGFTEACIDLPRRKVATVTRLRRLREGADTGAAVRFFGDQSVSYISEGMGLAFVAAAIPVMGWVWEATKIDGLGRGWGAEVYADSVKEAWTSACKEAVEHWRRRRGGCDEDTNSYAGLAPGTLVWGLCQDSPFWPGRIASEEEVKLSGTTEERPTPEHWHVPVVFCGGGAGFAWMSLGDIALYLPGFEWRGWMRARGEAEGRDRDWPDVKMQVWSKWQEACIDAEQEFALVHADVLRAPGRSIGPPGSASHASGGGGRRERPDSAFVETSAGKPGLPFQIFPGHTRQQRRTEGEDRGVGDVHPSTDETRSHDEGQCASFDEGALLEPSSEYYIPDSDVEGYDQLD